MDDENKPVLNYFNADAAKDVEPAEPEQMIGILPLLALIYIVFRIVVALA